MTSNQTVAVKEVIKYTPGFRWVEFRRSYTAIAMYSVPITVIIENYMQYMKAKEQE